MCTRISTTRPFSQHHHRPQRGLQDHPRRQTRPGHQSTPPPRHSHQHHQPLWGYWFGWSRPRCQPLSECKHLYLLCVYVRTELRKFLCTWFGEVCSCCCLSLLPQLACNILATAYKDKMVFDEALIQSWENFFVCGCENDAGKLRQKW